MKQSFYDVHISKDPFDLAGMPSQGNFSVIDGLNNFSLVYFGHDHSKHHFICNNKSCLPIEQYVISVTKFLLKSNYKITWENHCRDFCPHAKPHAATDLPYLICLGVN